MRRVSAYAGMTLFLPYRRRPVSSFKGDMFACVKTDWIMLAHEKSFCLHRNEIQGVAVKYRFVVLPSGSFIRYWL